MTGRRGTASRVVTTVGASAATIHRIRHRIARRHPRCLVAHLGGDGRPVAAQNTHPPSRAVVLHLTAKRPWAEVMAGRPDSATSRMLSPFPAQVRPKFGSKCGPVLWRAVAPPMYPPFTQAARFGHGEVRVCRNQRVVRARLISRPHRCFGAPERSGHPFHRHWSDFEPSRQFKAPWQA